jgi:hypothetical protein
MPETTWLDKRSLLIQLESYELVFEVNVHLLETDRLLAEQISHRFGMLETEVHELELGERAGDSVRYDCALDRANQILHGIKSLIDQMLDLDAFPYDDSLQKLA